MQPIVTEKSGWTMERIPKEHREDRAVDYVLAGLTRAQKTLPPVLLYDARGSELFDSICETDAYYQTRTERALLETYGPEISRILDERVTLSELGSGSGSSLKTEALLDILLKDRKSVRYIPVDISESALREAADRLVAKYGQDRVSITGIVGEYEDGFKRVRKHLHGQGFGVFMGGNLGNLEPPAQLTFLHNMLKTVTRDGFLLCGLDLVKSRDRVELAYNDPEGFSAGFNLNVLHRLNREMGADFDVDSFEHRAIWNPSASRMEMHVRSLKAQRVRIKAAELVVDFRMGETIHTESSYKFTEEGIQKLAATAGWRLHSHWVDAERLFSINLLAPADGKDN